MAWKEQGLTPFAPSSYPSQKKYLSFSGREMPAGGWRHFAPNSLRFIGLSLPDSGSLTEVHVPPPCPSLSVAYHVAGSHVVKIQLKVRVLCVRDDVVRLPSKRTA